MSVYEDGGLAAMLGGAPEEAPQEEGGDPADLLREILDLAAAYREVEPDEEDRLAIERVTTLIQQLLARNQKESDQAMQGSMNPRTLRKAYG